MSLLTDYNLHRRGNIDTKSTTVLFLVGKKNAFHKVGKVLWCDLVWIKNNDHVLTCAEIVLIPFDEVSSNDFKQNCEENCDLYNEQILECTFNAI